MSILSCSAPDCDAPVFVKKSQLCQPHYNRFQRYGDLNIEIPSTACLRCSGPMPPKVRTSGPSPKYCGDDCKRQAAYERCKESGAYELQLKKKRAKFSPKPALARNCLQCTAEFISKRDDALFCSQKCTNRFRDANNPSRCSESDCNRGVRAKGLCAMHWRRKARLDGRETSGPWSDRRKANYHQRRVLKLQLPADNIRPADVYERDEWTCGLCSEPVDRNMAWPDPMSPSLDHVLPLSKGGHHVMANVQLAHLSCNVRKGARIEESVSA